MSASNPYRDLSTLNLLAARECTGWDRADLATDPAGWDYPDQSAAYLALAADAIEAELARRERLRAHPLAPSWPQGRDDLDAIRQAIDLPALIEKYAPVRFHRAGRQVRSRCPFHDGASDTSLAVNPDEAVWHCFGCLKGGDCFSFVEALLGLDFPAAVDFLAREAGIERPRRLVASKGHGRIRPQVGSVRVA